MKKSQSIIIWILLITFVGGGAFFLGKSSSVAKPVSEFKSFAKSLPKTSPDYLGEIISIDGNLVSIKYFDKSETPFANFSNRREFIKSLRNLSTTEKVTMGERLQQKVLGSRTVLVPIHTPIYLKKNSPKLINFAELRNGDFIVIWGNLNDKGQVISDFILTANPKNYEK